MFSRRLVAALALSAAFVTPSFAQQTTLSSVKCGDFLIMDSQIATRAVIWLQGYYTYEDDVAVVDMDKEKSKEAEIKQYCTDHRDIDLIAASAIFMDKKYAE
jgi:hypothetical protein